MDSGHALCAEAIPYHSGAKPGFEVGERLKVMGRRLVKAIVTPAMLVTGRGSAILAYREGCVCSPWLRRELAYVAGFSAVYGYLAVATRAFAENRDRRSRARRRVVNEAPTPLIIFVVILAASKPW
jgi:putative membrane protein